MTIDNTSDVWNKLKHSWNIEINCKNEPLLKTIIIYESISRAEPETLIQPIFHIF